MRKKTAKETALSPLKGKLPLVFLAPLLKLVECVCELFVPVFVSRIVDDALTSSGEHYQDAGYAFMLVGIIFALAIVGFSATMLTQFVSSKVSARFGFELRNLLFRKIASLSNAELDQYGKNRILNLTGSDASAVQNGVLMFMRLLARAPFLIIGSIVASFMLSPIGGLFVLVSFALCAASVIVVILLTPKQYRKLQSELDEIATRGEDSLYGRRLIRGFEIQASQKEGFNKANRGYRKRAIILARISSLTNPLTFAFANMGVVLVLYAMGANGPSNMAFSVGVGIALINYLTQSLAAFLQFTRLLSTLSKAMVSKGRVDSFLALSPTMKEGEITQIECKNAIFSLKNVSKGFGGEEAVIKGIDLQIKPGEKLGIFGPTGSGKSVLLRLLCRDYDPSGGEIRLGERNIASYAFKALRNEISYAGASSGFFRGSLRYNLTLGKGYGDEEILAALEKAQAKDFVMDHEEGLEREVNERGSNFSGGQRQRLLLARAFLLDRPVAIYDDVTSALDAKTDYLIRKEIFAKKDQTVLFVSGKVNSFSSCDRVIVLSNGEIFASGTHEELLSTCDFYKQVHELQRKEV